MFGQLLEFCLCWQGKAVSASFPKRHLPPILELTTFTPEKSLPVMSPDWRERLAFQRNALRHVDQEWVDADVHLTPRCLRHPELAAREESEADYFHGRTMDAAEILAEMDLANVRWALVWQNPSATPPAASRKEAQAYLHAANEAVHAAAEIHPDRLVAAGWTDPKALGLEEALDMVRCCTRSWGMPVVKMNPAQNAYPMDCDEVLKVTDAIIAEGAVPAFHYGADTVFTPPEALGKLAHHVAPHPLIAVHGGGGGASYREQESMAAASRTLALIHDNLFVIHSAKRDVHMASDLLAFYGTEACKRIALGSDAPYGRMAWNFGGAVSLLEQLANPQHPEQARRPFPAVFTHEHQQDYLGANAARMLASAIDRLLGVQG